MHEAWQVFENPDHLAREAAAWLCRRVSRSAGIVAVCLSGGRTPEGVYRSLAQLPLRAAFPWERVHWFWTDERLVPPDDPRSNYRMARAAIFDRVPVPDTHIHPVPTVGLRPAEAAAAYERRLKEFYGRASLTPSRPLFEVTLLGLGEDGHTASLFPGSAALEETESWAVSVADARPEPRITLTYPALEASRHTAFLVSGASKREVLAAVARGVPLPATRLCPSGRTRWFVDRAAAQSPVVARRE